MSTPAKSILRVALPDINDECAAELLATLRELMAGIETHYQREAARCQRRRRCEEPRYLQQELFESSDPPF